jgi:hypothetical protein
MLEFPKESFILTVTNKDEEEEGEVKLILLFVVTLLNGIVECSQNEV